MSTSKLQEETTRLVYSLCGHLTVRENHRPEWLTDSKGNRLELDVYIPGLNLAVEIQGQQHFNFTPIFHKSYKDFLAQIERDKIKKEVCNNLNITLLEVLENSDIEVVTNTIKDRLVTSKYKTPEWTPSQWQGRRDDYIAIVTKFKVRQYKRRMRNCKDTTNKLKSQLLSKKCTEEDRKNIPELLIAHAEHIESYNNLINEIKHEAALKFAARFCDI